VDLLQQLHRIRQGISIGAVQLRPAAVIRGLVILALGLSAVRVVKSWFQRRYLPLTRLDVGMRQSVASLIGYAGYGAVTAVTLSALGVGVQQIAWVVSALALGVGFGLQAIIQNFVSGLILLAERPVRVGDWVALGEFEGDVRRIDARATQIQRLDRSTVIVPNSEFITKVVRNLTYGNPLGRVQVRLPMPLDTDVERVSAELLRAFQAHPEILEEPAPSVILDGIEGSNILFNAIGFVSSPRTAVRVRSAVLFDALAGLKKAGVMITPVQVVVAPLSTATPPPGPGSTQAGARSPH
jgi:small-conductance mechanosensitive channel